MRRISWVMTVNDVVVSFLDYKFIVVYVMYMNAYIT